MAVPTWTTGQVLTASDVNTWFVPISVIKGSDESVTSSTTLQNDDALVLALAASSTYEISCVLKVDGSTAGDIKVGFTGPSGATPLLFVDGLTVGAASGGDRAQFLIDAFADNGTFGTLGVGSESGMTITGTVAISTTAGNLQLQWAQGTSSAFATRVFASSYMVARRIS